MGELGDRRSYTAQRIRELQANLTDAASYLAGKACVYLTGSFGRGEASEFSDLDIFIVGEPDPDRPAVNGKRVSLLKPLDEICVKADLIKTSRRLGFDEFSGDGRYLTNFSVDDFTETLGRPEDDFQNTFTGRLLLLLESRPFLEEPVYKSVTEQAIKPYWRDFSNHQDEFIPVFFANDILRLWRTFCVNYEAFTQTVPPEKRAKRKVQNYKLKHSRMLTCFSAILYLLHIYRSQGTVREEDVFGMMQRSPTERVEWLIENIGESDAGDILTQVLTRYENFLSVTHVQEADLIRELSSQESSRRYFKDADDLGDLISRALPMVGGQSLFYRMLVV